MRRLLVGGLALAALLAAIPVTAFVVVPAFVRSSLHEPPPGAQVAPAATSPPAVAAPVPTVAPVLRGDLRRVDPVHYGTGRVLIEGGYLRFEDVEIAAAPNMFVYLSDRQDGSPGTFTDLGPLRATSGSFNYQLPAGLRLESVRSVVIWCRAFSVTVTYAVLGSETSTDPGATTSA